jgi:hypothetical protein
MEWRSERVRELDDLGGAERPAVGSGNSFTAKMQFLEVGRHALQRAGWHRGLAHMHHAAPCGTEPMQQPSLPCANAHHRVFPVFALHRSTFRTIAARWRPSCPWRAPTARSLSQRLASRGSTCCTQTGGGCSSARSSSSMHKLGACWCTVCPNRTQTHTHTHTHARTHTHTHAHTRTHTARLQRRRAPGGAPRGPGRR